MKTPITYYGGKQRMVRHLKEMIPEHSLLYVEPFIGGGALFWNKEPHQAEVINDIDDNVVNFYRVVQSNFEELFGLLQSTLHSRSQHQAAKYVLKKETEKLSETYAHYLGENRTISEPVRRAWAFWMQANMSFNSKLYGGFAYCRSDITTKALINKRDQFQHHYKDRLKGVCIECNDAIKVIESRDAPYTFHYCDPPYINTDMGHYKGYTAQDFENLLTTLSKIKGMFLLSGYPTSLLDAFSAQYGWKSKKFDQHRSAGRGRRSRKTEVLTWNY